MNFSRSHLNSGYCLESASANVLHSFRVCPYPRLIELTEGNLERERLNSEFVHCIYGVVESRHEEIIAWPAI